MTRKNYIFELIRYLIIYPLYYILGMFAAAVLCQFIMGWSYTETKVFFFVLAGGMWIVSYIIHFNLFLFSLKGLKSTKSV
ncbi:hypothetical protein [Aliikangiella sp. IMCC44359]|uniref:hypothetical protein n=1 Tax=Aliikangiella sp. IMCC44359 TaxID=3459125 RepID=UPI00403B2046